MTPLSASRIKTLQGCSWTYWCDYILKLPDKSNAGAIMGSCCHNIFECLGNPRHKHHYMAILEEGSIKASPSIVRYVLTFLRKNGIDPAEKVKVRSGRKSCFAFDNVDFMILQGLRYDFYGEDNGAEVVESEQSFDLEKEEGDIRYRIRGFIDKLFLFKKGTEALVRDFKSSKQVFAKKEIEDNMQDLMYQLAVYYLYPDVLKTSSEFVFLQFECEEGGDGVQVPEEVTREELEGFEYFLTDIQNLIDNFSEEDAKSNFAADKGHLSEDYGFAGLSKCAVYPWGYSVDSPEQTKADGSTPWCCSNKWGRIYYVRLDEDGNILESRDSEEELSTPSSNETVEKRVYKGCPAWAHLDYNVKFRERYKDFEDGDCIE